EEAGSRLGRNAGREPAEVDLSDTAPISLRPAQRRVSYPDAMSTDDGRAGVQLAELVALLSLGTDLGLGQPMEHMIRACLIGLRLAEDVGLGQEERAVVYYSGLLAWVGCHTDAYEQAKWLGDDTTLKSDAHYA